MDTLLNIFAVIGIICCICTFIIGMFALWLYFGDKSLESDA